MQSAPQSTPGSQRRGSLDVFLLGMVDFESAVALQEIVLQEISQRDDHHGVVLVCEHLPLLTIGREGSHAHLLCEKQELVARQIATRWINRGGASMIHSPGQVAFYPILPLARLGIGLKEYRDLLVETALRTSAEFRIGAERTSDQAGLRGRVGQFAFVGTAVKSWVSYHGLFMNVNPRLDWMRLVKCHPSGLRPSSLEVERMHPIGMHAVRECLVRHFAELSGFHRYHLYTGHPLLRRTRRKLIHAGNC